MCGVMTLCKIFKEKQNMHRKKIDLKKPPDSLAVMTFR